MSRETPPRGLPKAPSERAPNPFHEEIKALGFKPLPEPGYFQRGNIVLHASENGVDKLFFKGKSVPKKGEKETYRSITADRYKVLLFAPGTKLVSYETVDEPMFEDRPDSLKTKYHYLKLKNDRCSFTLKCTAEAEHPFGYIADFDFHVPVSDEWFPLDPQREVPTIPATRSDELHVGLPNEDERIRGLKHINGQSIRELEYRMAPKPDMFTASRYLGPKESLLGLLEQDNAFVRSQGVTHQEIARRLFTMTQLALLLGHPLGEGYAFEFNQNGQTYHIGAQFSRGPARSPFEDGTEGTFTVMLDNVGTGTLIKFSSLHPHMIHRYGFYEGHGPGIYRLEPKDAIECLGLGAKQEEEKE